MSEFDLAYVFCIPHDELIHRVTAEEREEWYAWFKIRKMGPMFDAWRYESLMTKLHNAHWKKAAKGSDFEPCVGGQPVASRKESLEDQKANIMRLHAIFGGD